jgi:hypothetical protein
MTGPQSAARAPQSHSRPRGFVTDWNPQPQTRALLHHVREVLEQYRQYLPLTVRQIYYRLVASIDYPKDERAYGRLGEMVALARRARRLSFNDIRDDGFVRKIPAAWSNPGELWAAITQEARTYRLDRQEGQTRRLIVWCEAGGMVPQLERVCVPFGIPVYSSGGFDSVTVKHEIAREFSSLGPVEVLHIGDFDPSGVHVFASLDEDVRAFLTAMGGDAVFTRLAVTPAQITQYQLPTAPPKKTDKRSFAGTATTQAEALPPDTLADILRQAIEARLDMDIRHAVLSREADERDRLIAAMADVSEFLSEGGLI